MPAITNVRVIIDAIDNATAVLRGLAGQFNTLGKSADNLGKDLQRIGQIALVNVGVLTAFATKAAFSAARVEELTFALHAIAKANKLSNETVDEAVTKLREMNIAHEKAIQITSLFVQGQLDLTDAVKLATAAKDLAIVAGLDSSEATRTLTEAILTQHPMLLRQFGIVKSLDQIYEEYSKSVGGTKKELTELEKRQAFLNAILTEGQKVVGTYDAAMDSVSKRYRSLTGRIIPDFIAEVGKAFSPALTVIIDAITKSIEEMGVWIEQNKNTIDIWGEKLAQVAMKGIEFLGLLVNFLINNKEIFVGVLAAIAVGLGALAAAFIAAHAVAILVITGVIAVVTLLAKVWNENFLGIQDVVAGFVERFKLSWQIIQTTVQTVTDWFIITALPVIKSFFTFIYDLVMYFVAVWQFQWAIIKVIVNIVVNWFMTYVFPYIQQFFNAVLPLLEAYVESWKYRWNMLMTTVKAVVDWFMTYVYPTIESAFNLIKKVLQALWEAFKERFDWIKEKVEGVVNFIKNLLDNFKPRIDIGINLPNIEEAWQNLKQRAHKLGIPGFQAGGIVPGPIGQPALATVHGGERVIPAGVSPASTVGGGPIFNVYVGLYAGTETERRNIARDLYASLVQVAQSQNKSVRELMGG